MIDRQGVLRFLLILVIAFALPSFASNRPFTVSDDIELSHFGDPYSGQLQAVTFSPDQRWFVVATERGSLARNRPEATLRFYNTDAVRQFVSNRNLRVPPAPFWTICEATYSDGPLIKSLRWLPDSSGVAFLILNNGGYDQLFLADLRKQRVRALTRDDQYVTGFDIHSAKSFVYTALSEKVWNTFGKEENAASVVGTGRILYTLLFPGEHSVIAQFNDLSELWANLNGRVIHIKQKVTDRPIWLHYEASKVLTLSSDGRFVITAAPLETIPPDWETSFASKLSHDPYGIRAGTQDIEALNGAWYVSEYVRIELATGRVTALTNAPIGEYAGWWTAPVSSAWTHDGSAVVLSNTFLQHIGRFSSRSEGPCIALVMQSEKPSCLERLNRSDHEPSHGTVTHVDLEQPNRVVVTYANTDGSQVLTLYSRNGNAESWVEQSTRVNAFNVTAHVQQGVNDPPVLVAEDKYSNSRVILDPNPQLKELELTKASLFKWQDKAGREWIGGLYKPLGYVSGTRYPLVIQTHGFHPDQFRPDGIYPTAFAAQELAASGIMVLQAPDCGVSMDPNEGPCSVELFDSAIEKLSSDGLINPDKIGIIGFSRTCYYVMEALTLSKIHFAAASITDGVNEGYFQYLIDIDTPGNGIVPQANSMMGSPPFGSGFTNWLQRSPEFNLEKVTAPLQVVVTRKFLVDDWEPYAGLRILDKPVDLIVLRNGTHVLTNPAERLASQGGTLDWFRFWLLDFEDPNPAKASQYIRWKHLRILQKNAE